MQHGWTDKDGLFSPFWSPGDVPSGRYIHTRRSEVNTLATTFDLSDLRKDELLEHIKEIQLDSIAFRKLCKGELL